MNDATANSTKPAVATDTRKDSSRPFHVYTVTTGRAFINAMTRVMRDGEDTPLYFAKVGLITGWTGDSQRKSRERVQFVDVLISSSLKPFCEQTFAGVSDEEARVTIGRENDGYPLANVPVHVELQNLHFDATVSEDASRAFVGSQGILSRIALGNLD